MGATLPEFMKKIEDLLGLVESLEQNLHRQSQSRQSLLEENAQLKLRLIVLMEAQQSSNERLVRENYQLTQKNGQMAKEIDRLVRHNDRLVGDIDRLLTQKAELIKSKNDLMDDNNDFCKTNRELKACFDHLLARIPQAIPEMKAYISEAKQ